MFRPLGGVGRNGDWRCDSPCGVFLREVGRDGDSPSRPLAIRPYWGRARRRLRVRGQARRKLPSPGSHGPDPTFLGSGEMGIADRPRAHCPPFRPRVPRDVHCTESMIYNPDSSPRAPGSTESAESGGQSAFVGILPLLGRASALDGCSPRDFEQLSLITQRVFLTGLGWS